MRQLILVAVAATALAGCASSGPRDAGGGERHLYIPPPPDTDNPPPFSTSTWILYARYSEYGCIEAPMALHYKAWREGDRDLSMRALDGVCYDPATRRID